MINQNTPARHEVAPVYKKTQRFGGKCEVRVGTQKGMDQQLIARAQSGDRLAFQLLIKSYLPLVVALAFRMLNDKAEAEDLAQEVMLKLWQNLKSYDSSRAQLSTWIYKIASNRCLDQLRRKKPDQLADDYDEAVAPAQDHDLYEKQINKKVESALQDLPERQRLALVLFHYQGESLSETGQIMGCSSEAVESLLARARRALKVSLKPIWQQMKQEKL